MSGRGKRQDEDPLKDGERRFLQWEVPCDQITELMEMTTEDIQLRFEEILELRNRQTCPREAALLDCYVSGFCWARQASFTPAQISFTIALLHMLLDNIREKQMSLVANVSELAKALQAARRFPAAGDSRPLLDTQQAKALSDYITTSLLSHYRLYQCLFTKHREELLIGMERTTEVTNAEDAVAPLEEGMSVDLDFRYLTPPPEQEQEEVKQEETGDPLHQQDEEEEKQEKEEFDTTLSRR